MTASAQGIDISSNQEVYTAAELRGHSFAFFRATLGTTETDRNFAANWANAKTAGICRGAYHELTNLSAVGTQSAHFISTVRARGAEPGDMLAVVASDYSGITGAEVREFADKARAAFPRCPVLVYSDLAVLPRLGDCTGYPLWVAWYSRTAPRSVEPWGTWHFWQWTGTGLDRDAFNGTAAGLRSWLDSYAHPAPPPDWAYGPPRNLAVRAGHTGVHATWAEPADAPEKPASYRVWVYKGRTCDASTLVDSYPRSFPEARTGTSGHPDPGGLERRTLYTLHVSAFGPGGSRARPGIYASTTFTTGG